MLRILMWETDDETQRIFANLNENVASIVGIVKSNYISDDSINGYLDRYTIILPDMINNIEFDYIIVPTKMYDYLIQDIVSKGIDEQRILKWIDIFRTQVLKYDFFNKKLVNFNNRYKELLKSNEHFEAMITGISYHEAGISDMLLGMNAYNFAIKSQDIYYDYLIFKYLYEHYDLKKMKYAIIGMCYYSFEYDMSKSVNGWEIIRYYPTIDNVHNLIATEYVKEYFDKTKKELNKYLELPKLDYRKPIFSYEEGKRCADIDYNKNYPVTVVENQMILDSYITYCMERAIEPIIVIMPATKYYRESVSKEWKKKFYLSLDKVLNGRKIRVFDCFTDDYDDSLYANVTHFNIEGAKSFSKYLADRIKNDM